jgi:hypothetical protein
LLLLLLSLYQVYLGRLVELDRHLDDLGHLTELARHLAHPGHLMELDRHLAHLERPFQSPFHLVLGRWTVGGAQTGLERHLQHNKHTVAPPRA